MVMNITGKNMILYLKERPYHPGEDFFNVDVPFFSVQAVQKIENRGKFKMKLTDYIINA